MEYTQITTEKKGRVLIITINRPEVMNAMQPTTHKELSHAFDSFEKDEDAFVAILTGAGEKSFSTGNDLKFMSNRTPEQAAGAAAEMKSIAGGFGGLTERFTCLKPIIAAVNGFALGGGMEMTLACDLIVAAEHARFGIPEVAVGVNALAGGLYRLHRRIPFNKAMELALTGRNMSAQEAYQFGLVNQVVPSSELMDAALALANKICDNSPLAVRASKQIIHESIKYDIEECFDLNKYPAVKRNMDSEDFREGPKAFAQKRKPEWKGR